MGLRIFLFSFFLLAVMLHSARSDDTSSELLDGLNKYRNSLNLSKLTENKNAACLAEQVALAFKDQDCSNSTGSDTVPGTEQQFPNFPDYLSTCHLNATVTRDGSVLPACVPGLVSDLVLSNYTKSQYNQNLNDSSVVGIGIADEGNWIVVVLTTNTDTGNYAPAVEDATTGSAASTVGFHYAMLLLVAFAMFLVS
ncbi:GPI-anchored protein [Canna indica]|uniref:GPI-anchored protein n=1 Tax=Canna indica TaxID=4628 RepID=A0AAQ3QAS1_9LILI|nr:GPI-anchored protein [Canna indica]